MRRYGSPGNNSFSYCITWYDGYMSCIVYAKNYAEAIRIFDVEWPGILSLHIRCMSDNE